MFAQSPNYVLICARGRVMFLYKVSRLGTLFMPMTTVTAVLISIHNSIKGLICIIALCRLWKRMCTYSRYQNEAAFVTCYISRVVFYSGYKTFCCDKETECLFAEGSN